MIDLPFSKELVLVYSSGIDLCKEIKLVVHFVPEFVFHYEVWCNGVLENVTPKISVAIKTYNQSGSIVSLNDLIAMEETKVELAKINNSSVISMVVKIDGENDISFTHIYFTVSRKDVVISFETPQHLIDFLKHI